MQHLIINNDHLVVATAAGAVNEQDLAARGLRAVPWDGPAEPGHLLADDALQAPPSPFHRAQGGAWTLDGQGRASALAAARALRDHKLAALDWTQLPDAPLSLEAQAGYRAKRQALRDFFQGYDGREAEAYQAIQEFT